MKLVSGGFEFEVDADYTWSSSFLGDGARHG